MNAVIIIAGMLMGWAVLRLIGGERERRMLEIQAKHEASLLENTPPSDPPAMDSPVRSKAGR